MAAPWQRSRMEEMDLELGILSSEKREVQEHLTRLQHCLSDSVVQERKAQQRVEKQQMMLHFHRTRAAIVSRQILKVSGELKEQEQSAWEVCQEKRAKREARGRARAGCGTLDPLTMRKMVSTSPAVFKPAAGQRASSVPTSVVTTGSLEAGPSPPPSSSSTAGPGAPAAYATTWDGGSWAESKGSNVQAPYARTSVKEPTSPKPWSTKRSTTPGSPPSTAGGRRDGMLQLGSRLKSKLPPKGESDTTTLLDWFNAQEQTWKEEGRPSMQMSQGDLGATSEKGGDYKSSHERRQEVERKRKLKEEVKAQRRIEAERVKAEEETRKAEQARRDERRHQAEQRQLNQNRRENVRFMLKRCAGGAEEAFRALDQNRSGNVSLNEFIGGVNSLKLPWEEVTGLATIHEVFKLFDHDRKGSLDFAKLFPLEANQEVDPTRLSTPEYWKHFCRTTKDMDPDLKRGSPWDAGDPEAKLKVLSDARNSQEQADVKKEWMRGMIHRLKHKGKGDARCREIVALHLPRGTGPPDLQDVPTFSWTDVQEEKKKIHGQVQESVRNIEKTMYDLHEQRRSLHTYKQQLYAITEEPILRQKAIDDSRQSLMKIGDFGSLLSKLKDPKPEPQEVSE